MKKIIILATCITIAVAIFLIPDKLLQKSKDKNSIKIGVTADYPPFAYIKDHKLIGFDIDLITEIAKKMNMQIEFVDMAFNVLLTGVQQGKIDMIIGGISPNKERTAHLYFTNPYLSDDPLVIITLKPCEAKTIAELKGQSIVVNEGYTADLFMSKINGISLKRLPSITDAFMTLESKKSFAFVSALSSINFYLKQCGNNKFNINKIDNTNEKYAFAVSKQQPKLFKKVEETLEKITDEKTIEKLKNKWSLYD